MIYQIWKALWCRWGHLMWHLIRFSRPCHCALTRKVYRSLDIGCYFVEISCTCGKVFWKRPDCK